MPVHVRQPPVDAVVWDGEALVVDAQKMEHGGVDVVDLRGVGAVEGLVAPLITFSGSHSPLNAAAAEP
ncbi:uncharacterized protein METZ01_LOCUS479488, partial [marine metagenome]